MRTLSILRALALGAALSAPLAQAAMAQAADQQQQAKVQTDGGSGASFTGGGPYSNDAAMSPAVGD